MTLITTSNMLPEPWPGLLMQWPNGEKLVPYTDNTLEPSCFSPIAPAKRSRYLLRSINGFATESGFTDHPEEAIQLVDHESAARRIIASGRADLLPHLVHFEKHGETWQSIST